MGNTVETPGSDRKPASDRNPGPDLRIRNALTIDVEDYYHVTGYARSIDPRGWDTYESRVNASTQKLLDILARRNVHATFFVLGWVAERNPELIRAIHAAGHEIAYHSYWHRLVYDQTPEEFRADLRHGRALLEDMIGAPISGYRAPSFSITEKSLWALEILAEEGFRFDSSIFPVRHDRYGIPSAERFPHRIDASSGSVLEFPASIFRMGGLTLPIAGGGYFRLYPAFVSFYCMDQLNRGLGRPFMFYLHPWELDPGQPILPGSPWARFRHRVNLAKTEQKLECLLDRYRFGTMGDVLQDQIATGASSSAENAPKCVTIESMRGARAVV